MKDNAASFGLKQILFVMFAAATIGAVFNSGVFKSFLLAMFWTAAIVNSYSRFRLRNRAIVAGFHGIFAACLLGAICGAGLGVWRSQSVFGVLSAIGGLAVAFPIAWVPTFLISLVPDLYNANGEKQSNVVTSLFAYIVGA